MPICNACLAEVPAGSKFCTNCGALLSAPEGVKGSEEEAKSEDKIETTHASHKKHADPKAAEKAPEESVSQAAIEPEEIKPEAVEVKPEPVKAKEPEPVHQPQAPVYEQPAKQPAKPVVAEKPITAGSYAFRIILSWIPIIGLIYNLIVSLGKKHPNRAAFAKANLIFGIILHVIIIVAVILVLWVLPGYTVELGFMELVFY